MWAECVGTSHFDPICDISGQFAVMQKTRVAFNDVVGFSCRPKGSHEAARVHHVYWRCGYSSLRGTRAAEVDAGCRIPWYRPSRPERTEFNRLSPRISWARLR